MSGPVFDRLVELVKARDSCVCVGLDPHPDRLPATTPGATPLDRWRNFLCGVVEAVADVVPAVKPQIAFFEQMGPDGYSLYFEVVREAKRRGLFVIGDIKRGDIGSTAVAYARAHLGGAQDRSVDAVTVNPYLGSDGVLPFLKVGREKGRGVFVLVRTSNPSSSEIQSFGSSEKRLVDHVASLVHQWGIDHCGQRGFSDVGAVVGATHPQEAAALRQAMPHSFFLVPGYGAQGGGAKDVRPTFRDDGCGALISSSRGILFAGEAQPDANPIEAARAAAVTMTLDLRGAEKGGR